MRVFAVASLLAVLVCYVRGQCVGPCEGQECPRFLNAECRCDLGSRARFFRREREVTNRCSVPTCDTRPCVASRECMEEVFPNFCPENNPRCRQYIRTKCELRPFDRPLSCEDIECGQGMMCHFRERGGGFPPVVRCVPFVPQDCSELECEEGFTCILRGRRPVCIPEPTCSDEFVEICRAIGLACEVSLEGTEVCVNITSCDQVECERGFECAATPRGFECVPRFTAESCDDLDCLTFFKVCQQVSENLATCIEPTECTDEFKERCNELFSVCGARPNGQISCVTATSCDQLTCPEGSQCQEFLAPDNGTFATCVDLEAEFGLTCDDVSCGDNQGCLLTEYPSEDLSFAECSASSLLDSLQSSFQAALIALNGCGAFQCPNNTVCVDFRDDDLTLLVHTCVPLCINDSNCPGDQVCSISNSTAPYGLCAPPAFDPIASTRTCAQTGRECPSGLQCQNTLLDRELIATVCNTPISPQFGRTCEDVVCSGEDTGCSVSTLPDGLQLATCVQSFTAVVTGVRTGLQFVLCAEIECPEGFTCELDGRQPVCVAPTCSDDGVQFCRANGQACQVVLGTEVCVNITSCDQVECERGFECDETRGFECVPRFTAESCDDLDCSRIFSVCEQFTETFASCRPSTECTDEITEQCLEQFNFLCGPVEGTEFVTCVPPTSCDQINCTENDTCLVLTNSANGTTVNSTIAVCVPTTSGGLQIGLSCDNLACNEGSACLLAEYPTEELSVAQCQAEGILELIETSLDISIDASRSCSDSQVDCPIGTICIDLRQDDGTHILHSCILENCVSDSDCGIDNTSLCLEISDGSICAPTSLVAVAGTSTCEELARECPSDTECQNSFIDGELVGTVCNSQTEPVQIGDTCDDIECNAGEDEGCAVTTLPNGRSLATCQQDFKSLIETLRQGLRSLGLIP